MVAETVKPHVSGNIAVAHPPLVARMRFQILGALLVCVVVPVTLRGPMNSAIVEQEALNITGMGSAVAITFGYYLKRRIGFFPGVQLSVQIPFAISAAFALVVTVFFVLHLPYSRVVFATSYVSALLWFFLVHLAAYRLIRPQLMLVPGGNAETVAQLPGARWHMLSAPPASFDNISAVVADLRGDLSEEWERFLADCTLRGLPVLHTKQVQESLTGKVQIEHLSENNFGSLLPDLAYLRIKQTVDWALAVAFLPIFLLVLAAVAPLIMAESGRPVFYRQERVGYRGKSFRVFKFRTMRHRQPGEEDETDRCAAVTQKGDARITRVGRILRRYRIDELPQIANILMGEMSWVGPRPEVVSLSKWYEAELPFYRYRHVVRPGISGWAQVNQGHVALPHEVLEKLHYDFFYIKYLSPWLDLLIGIKTVRTVLRGFGAK